MKKDIILAGVGGQGILSIASCIGIAAVEKNMYLKQAEVHGMS
ncbi:MAG: indolepyruvate oxidoreductase, partial [Bacteroidales bacterium]|nr:indolepyruvate oxidoreductase [Bacteroidales bacterium]